MVMRTDCRTACRVGAPSDCACWFENNDHNARWASAAFFLIVGILKIAYFSLSLYQTYSKRANKTVTKKLMVDTTQNGVAVDVTFIAIGLFSVIHGISFFGEPGSVLFRINHAIDYDPFVLMFVFGGMGAFMIAYFTWVAYAPPKVNVTSDNTTKMGRAAIKFNILGGVMFLAYVAYAMSKLYGFSPALPLFTLVGVSAFVLGDAARDFFS